MYIKLVTDIIFFLETYNSKYTLNNAKFIKMQIFLDYIFSIKMQFNYLPL